MVEEGDERSRPTMLNGATCAPGSDSVCGGGPEFDAIVASIFPRLGPVGGLGVDHNGVATAEKECWRVEGRKGEVIAAREMPAREMIAASILASKSRKAGS